MDAEDEDESLEDGLWAIARDLDERLEETVTELAPQGRASAWTPTSRWRRSSARSTSATRSTSRRCPGSTSREERTVLGTFWRDTAVEQEEIEYFATGHPIVEALFGFLRDGPYGRNGCRAIEQRGPAKRRGSSCSSTS